MFILRSKKNKSDDEMYDSYLKKIKKAFKKLLIRIDEIPEINKKSVVRINHIDDLVDISLRTKKPIYYVEKDNKTCDFILINDGEYNIYTLKVNDGLLSSFDEYAKGLERKKKKINSDMFEELEKTTIIRVANGEMFKISPLKKRDKSKINLDKK